MEIGYIHSLSRCPTVDGVEGARRHKSMSPSRASKESEPSGT